MNPSKKYPEKSKAEELMKNIDAQNKALKKILKKLIKEKNSNKSSY